MERVRDVFVLPFHRIRRRIIFHALVLSPLRANDVRVTRGETQGLVFASSKEDESSSASPPPPPPPLREFTRSPFTAGTGCKGAFFNVKRTLCMDSALPHDVASNGSCRTTPSWRRETRRRRVSTTRSTAVVNCFVDQNQTAFLVSSLLKLFKIGDTIVSIIVRHNNFFYCFRDDEKRRRQSVFQSGEEDASSSSSDSSSDASLPRFLLLSDAFRDHLCRHPFPFVAAFLRFV